MGISLRIHARVASERAGHATFPVMAAFPLALLIAVAALGGILSPATYARDSANLAAQGVGQDWVNLLVVVPWLVITAIAALRGSRRALLLLGGGLAYTAYSYAVYAFGVHFNALFLIYCASLGLAAFALAGLVGELLRDDVRGWFTPGVPARLAAGVQIAIAAVFAALWLRDVVPAIATGTVPASVSADGLLTNPVHVLDLALVLPVLVVAAVALVRGRPLGYALTPILLGLATLMAVAIGGMVVFVVLRGIPAELTVAAVFAVVALACGAVLAALLRHVQPR